MILQTDTKKSMNQNKFDINEKLSNKPIDNVN